MDEKYKELENQAKELYRALDLMLQVFWPTGDAELGYAQERCQEFALIAFKRNESLKPSHKEQKAMSEVFKPLIEAQRLEIEKINEIIKNLKLKSNEHEK